jgi:hypothetical protein
MKNINTNKKDYIIVIGIEVATIFSCFIFIVN